MAENHCDRVSAVASTLLSLGAVVAHWTGLGADLLPWSRPETAVDLVRTFVVSFDVLVLTVWAPCAIVMPSFSRAIIR